VLSQETIERIRDLRQRYPRPESALLPALWAVQRSEGYLPMESLAAVAAIFGVTTAKVTSVASFYSMLSMEPRGRYVIQVCQSISCSLMGSDSIIRHLSGKLGIDPGETTEDGKFTLIEVECLASCGTAPMMQINDDYYENLTPDGVDQILEGLP